jgi:hypothetical protein
MDKTLRCSSTITRTMIYFTAVAYASSNSLHRVGTSYTKRIQCSAKVFPLLVLVSVCALLVSNFAVSFCEMADVPTVKRKSGQSLKRQERQTVVNVLNYTKAKKS